MRKNKILVTGANGQLGYKINEILGSRYELVLTDSDTMDITDEARVYKVIRSSDPDFIIHGAAYTKVDLAEEEKNVCELINATGTENIAKAASELDIPLVYISTDYVFDGKKSTPYFEDDKENPLSIYGKTKLEGEEIIRKLCKEYFIVRVSWLFGELPKNYSGSNFIETMLRLAANKTNITIVNDQVGSPTYTKDLVEIVDKLINQSPSYGIYHFSGEGACSWYDFAKEIFNLTKSKVILEPIQSNQYPQKAKRPSYSYMSKSKINKALKIKIRSWQEMVREYLEKR